MAMLDDLKKLLTGDVKHTAVPDLDESILGTRVSRAMDRAKAAGQFQGDDVFVGRRGNTSTIVNDLASYQDLRDSIETIKADGVTPSGLEKIAAKQQSDIGRKASKVYGDLGRAHAEHTVALEALVEQQGRVEADLQKQFAREYERLQKTLTVANKDKVMAQLENLRANHEIVRDKLVEHFNTAKDLHTDQLSRITDVVTELERETGIKATEHFKSGGSSVLAAETKAAGGIVQSIKNNWANSSGGVKFVRGAVTAVGAVLGVKGALDILAYVTGSSQKDEQGRDVPVDGGTAAKGFLELGAGAAAAYAALVHGGKGRGMHV